MQVRSQESGVRSQESEVRSQESGARQESGDRSQKSKTEGIPTGGRGGATKIGHLAGWNVDKKPQGCPAAGCVNLPMEPTMCKKLKALNRESGRMSLAIRH